MFTGIVQGMGQIVRIQELSADFRTHIVDLPLEIADDLQIGASVANNGCCLTITEIDGISQDKEKGIYWMFDVNGKIGEKAANQLKVQDGDEIKFYQEKYN